MDPNTVVLEISSDEDVDWNDHNGRGIADGGDDHTWLTKLLDEVNNENFGDDSDEVVLVKEVSPSKKSKLKSSLVDLDDDCVVLEGDPDKPVEVRNDDNPSKGDDDSDDIVVVSEKGQVACRDYPHPRHLCIKFSFSSTPKQNHCEQCYCYVCDSLAPCVYWGNGSAITDHCHATDKDELWRLERKNAKNGNKGIQPVPKFTVLPPPTMGLPRPPPILAQHQPHIQTQRPVPTYTRLTPPTFRPPNIINQNRNHVLASRNRLHPNLVSQFSHRTSGVKGHHQNYNQRSVFKRTGTVGSYRGNFGNSIRQQQNYPVVRSLQQNSVNNSVLYPPQSQNFTSSTVNVNVNPIPNPNPLLNQPLPPQPQFLNHPNPTFQPGPFPVNPHYQPMVPAQPSYPVPSQTRVESPLVPVSGFTQNISEGNQVQNPTIDAGFKDYDLTWPPSQTSGPTNESSISGSLADYQYDWIFDHQPVEPGLVDYGLTDFSSDSSFIDTGPIFEF